MAIMSRIKSRGIVCGMGRLGPSSMDTEDMGIEECMASRDMHSCME